MRWAKAGDGRLLPAIQPGQPGRPTRLPIGVLLPADSPRLAGPDAAHVRALADQTAPLPPILVHRATRRVIDGMHRLRAAELRGDPEIEVEFVDLPAGDLLFVLAVEANLGHGLPLPLPDRKAAAARILRAYPHWSDRAIAASTGLSTRTVRVIRDCPAGAVPQLNARVGRDGRVRPLTVAAGRQRAYELLQDQPTAPLRRIAQASGISLGTAWDVRERLRRGAGPLPGSATTLPPDRPHATVEAIAARTPAALLRALRADPSLRLTAAGRDLLRWLDRRLIEPGAGLAGLVPPHAAPVVAEIAAGCADAWLTLAAELRDRAADPVPAAEPAAGAGPVGGTATAP